MVSLLAEMKVDKTDDQRVVKMADWMVFEVVGVKVVMMVGY